MDLNHLRLCGGTFLVLLNEAKIETKASFGQKRSSSISELVFSLLNLFNDGYTKETINMDTLKTRASGYKLCSENLTQLKKEELIAAFDFEIKNNYDQKLSKMNELIRDNLCTKVETTLKKVIKSIIDLITFDETISNDALFYALPNGNPITKQELINLKKIDVPSFLLGVFHYIVSNVRDNTIGRPTIENWIPNLGTKTGTSYTISTGLGNNFNELSLFHCMDSNQTNAEPTVEPEINTPDDIAYETNSNKSTNENQTINVNYQFGRNNFNNIGSLTFIDKD